MRIGKRGKFTEKRVVLRGRRKEFALGDIVLLPLKTIYFSNTGKIISKYTALITLECSPKIQIIR